MLVKFDGRFLVHENPNFPHRTIFALLRLLQSTTASLAQPCAPRGRRVRALDQAPGLSWHAYSRRDRGAQGQGQ